jgi:MSHA biogenesis protein MshN
VVHFCHAADFGERRRLEVLAMSVINQMLMDLEKRHAPRPVGVLSQARALPLQVTRYPRWRFPLLALAVAAAIFAWVMQHKETPSPPAIADTPVQAPAVPATPAQTIEKVLTENPAVSESLLGPASRMSLELSTEPKERELVVSKPAAKAKNAVEPVVIAKAKPVAEQQSPPAIRKQVTQETPQQRAQEEYRKAVVSLQQGQQVEAQEGFRRALQLNPNFTVARLALSGLLLESRQLAEAEHVLREGLELDIRQPGLAMMLARVQVNKDETQAGLETLQKTLPYAMGNADYHAFMAALLLRESRHADAVEHYRTALNLKQAGVWYIGLGISLQAMQRLPEAQDAFQQAISSGALAPDLQSFVEKRLKQISISMR